MGKCDYRCFRRLLEGKGDVGGGGKKRSCHKGESEKRRHSSCETIVRRNSIKGGGFLHKAAQFFFISLK